MKNLLVCLITILTTSLHAQTFEGTIRWSFKTEITDPAMKQKMEQAKTQMADPKNQAQMKELEQKMKDPQFQKMMEQNPQLKAQMEKMIAAQQSGGGGGMESMMPKAFIIKAKAGNTITKIEGGMMESEILYLKDKDQRYSIKRDAKTYSPLPKGEAKADTAKPHVKVTKTKETAKILNYNCTKYIVESTDPKNTSFTAPQSIWATTEIKDIDPKAFAKASVGKGQKITYDGIEGFPMRITMNSKEMNMAMEVVEINKAALNSSDFAIPAGFTETKTSGGY
jgi:hypothetical protein